MLFSIPEIITKDLFQIIREPKNIECTNIITDQENILIIQLFHALKNCEVLDHTDFLDNITSISNNLFRQLAIPLYRGKRYKKEKQFSPQQKLFSEFDDNSGSRPISKTWSREKTSPNSFSINRLDIWDLIFPILSPPLDFDFPQEIDFPDGCAPYPYQWEGIKFLIEHPEALLADETGTGKTVMASVSLRILFNQGKVNRCLIVCPPGALDVWDDHLYRWAPELRFTVVTGTKEIREYDWRYPAHIYLTTYDKLVGDLSDEINSSFIKDFDIVMIDEAQKIKNPDIQRSKSVKSISSTWRWAITATPMENKLDDLVSIFDFIKPGYLKLDGLTSENANGLIKPFTKRRTKKEVKYSMPDKIKSEIWLDLDEEQRKFYNAWELRERRELEELGEKITRVHIFAVIQRLKQICNFQPDKHKSPKTEALLEKLEEITQQGSKVLVFSQYIPQGVDKISQLLTRKNYNYVTYKGGMSDVQRKNVVNRFKNDPDVTIFLGTLGAAAESLNLQEATYVIHFDHWWNPAKMWQAEDRAYRITQEETVNVYSFWMKGTIEAKIHQKLREKGLLFQKIVGGLSEKQIEGLISTEEWLDILGVKIKKEPAKRPAEGLSLEKIFENIGQMDPLHFEDLVKNLFRKFGYENAKTTKRSHDGGIDIKASRAIVGGIEKVIVQCKRMSKVGIEHARNLLGVLAADPTTSKAYLVTTGLASPECKIFCDRDGRLALIEGPLLSRYIEEFGIKINF